jgi:PAS domain S-box-containing protein
LRLAETSRDELGQLAGELNKMAESLAEQQTLLRRRAEQFFNLSLDLLCTINPSGRLLDLNPAWERTLGYSREELHGQQLINLIHPDDISLTTSALQRVTGNRAGRFESRVRHKDGQYRWLAWVVVLSSQDQLLYAAARDITERRLSEENLRQKTDELQRSNQELEQFAYVASHDLQEPLHLVSGYVQLLARRYKGKLDADADEFIAYAIEGVNRMRDLIADLLAYSRIGSSRKEFAPVILEDTFNQVLENLQPVIDNAHATVTHDPLPSVLGDDTQMIQLLQNLIDNAIKFRGVELPHIHVGASQMEDRLLFFVRDNGIGIDPQYTEKVFVIFQRLHTPDKYPGTGIGLAICRKIVERHGGRIWVDSEPGKGSTFYFTLTPAEAWSPEQVPAVMARPRSKDTIVDRASDLI